MCARSSCAALHTVQGSKSEDGLSIESTHFQESRSEPQETPVEQLSQTQLWRVWSDHCSPIAQKAHNVAETLHEGPGYIRSRSPPIRPARKAGGYLCFPLAQRSLPLTSSHLSNSLLLVEHISAWSRSSCQAPKLSAKMSQMAILVCIMETYTTPAAITITATNTTTTTIPI